jgi:hypothetical protein
MTNPQQRFARRDRQDVKAGVVMGGNLRLAVQRWQTGIGGSPFHARREKKTC